MGCFDVFCPLCGAPVNNNVISDLGEFLSNPPKIPRPAWLKNATLLLPGQKAKHGFEEINCNVTFASRRTGKRYDVSYEYGVDGIGMALHTDCWKYAKMVLGRSLVLEDFDLTKRLRIPGSTLWEVYLFKYLDYSQISPFYAQDFETEAFCQNTKNLYMLYSPMTNSVHAKKNKKRIRSNIRLLDKFKPRARKSPLYPSRMFAEGDRVRGGDGNMYCVKKVGKHTRWVKA